MATIDKLGFKVYKTRPSNNSSYCRWYIDFRQNKRRVRERLSTHVKRLQKLGLHKRVECILSEAIRLGYRIR